MKKVCLSILLLGIIFHTALFAEEVPITNWLKLGPLPVQSAAFTDSGMTLEAALELQPLELDQYRPADGMRVDWSPGVVSHWEGHSGEKLVWKKGETPFAIAYGCAYLNITRWQKLTIKVMSSRPIKLFVDGAEKDKATSQNADSVYEISAEFEAHTGQHTLLVQSVSGAEDAGDWTLSMSAEMDEEMSGSINFDSDPSYAPANYADYARFEDLTNTCLSPDGKYVAVLHKVRDADLKQKAWLEVFETGSGKPVETIRMTTNVGSPQFLPQGHKLAFTTSEDGKTTLWTFDFTTRAMEPVLKDIKGFSSAQFSPDGKFVYYAASDPPDDKDNKYDFYLELEDKLSTYDPYGMLYVKSLSTGVVQQLTAPGEYALDIWKLSPDGSKLVLVRKVPRNTRPYSTFEFWVMDVQTRDVELIDSRANIEFPQWPEWISESQLAYVLGSHDADPADTVYHNAENTLLFLLDLKAKKSTSLFKDADYCVTSEGHRSVFWNPQDKQIWFHAIIGGERTIMKIDPRGGEASVAVDSKFDFVDLPALSKDGSTVAYIASDNNHPDALFVQTTRGRSEKKIFDPNAKLRTEWVMGKMQDWDFVNEDGYNIDGWLYTPANFDAGKKWPLVVYYYGGVSPRDLRFIFTYEWWLANGYCVYVLNPVGAFGYGQEFADKHANDWGRLATRDVIEGTEKFLNAHEWVDRARVGAYGGSYGGFITLDLVTRTNLFAAAVDMYGISNITNYFGAGTWGFWYSDVASPGSFPWSDRDIYVDRSPMFSADKIKTPLLIMHGGSDPNVPPSESDQMFVALKLLGQDVAYAKFRGETHNINVKFANLIEHREMMLEWFDKYLKGQPEAWEARLRKDGKQ